MEKASGRRHQDEGIREKASWRRHHWGGSMEEASTVGFPPSQCHFDTFVLKICLLRVPRRTLGTTLGDLHGQTPKTTNKQLFGDVF